MNCPRPAKAGLSFWPASAQRTVRTMERAFPREWDVVLCPVTPTPAFAHDHSSPIEARHIEIDAKDYPYLDAYLVWAGLASKYGPTICIPIGRPFSERPIGTAVAGRPGAVRIARRLRLPNSWSGSSAASYRLPVTPDDGVRLDQRLCRGRLRPNPWRPNSLAMSARGQKRLMAAIRSARLQYLR
jgi:hypothetical protein